MYGDLLTNNQRRQFIAVSTQRGLSSTGSTIASFNIVENSRIEILGNTQYTQQQMKHGA